MDVVGPFLKSSAGHQYILEFMDYAIWNPEVEPLHAVMARWIAEELIKWISQVGTPKEILMDMGQNFVRGTVGCVLDIRH